MTARRIFLDSCLRPLLCVLLLLLLTSPADAGEERSPRQEQVPAALRKALTALESEDAGARKAAFETVARTLGRKNASSHRWLTPVEYTRLAEGAFDEALALLASEGSRSSASLALGGLQNLCGHSPDTKDVVARRAEELVPLFGAVDRWRLRSLLSVLHTLGTPADILVPQVAVLLTGSDKSLSRQAGLTLGMIGGPQARTALRNGGRHASEEVRYAAYRGWRYVRILDVSEVRTLLSEFDDELVGALARGTCIAFMGTIEGETEPLGLLVEQLTLTHLASSEPGVRRAGCKLLGAIGLPARTAAARLAALAVEDPNPPVRLAAARALGRVDKSEASARRIMDAAEAPGNRDDWTAFVELLRPVRGYARAVLPRLENLIRETEDENEAYTTRQMIREIEREGLYLRSILTLEAGEERVRSLAWSPTGQRLAAGCSDRTLRIWQPDKSKPTASLVLPRYG